MPDLHLVTEQPLSANQGTEAGQPSSANQGSKKGQADRRDVTALNLILNTKPELFCNIIGEPCIRLPPVRDGPAWPLRSTRVRAWIADSIWEEAGLVLFEQEINRLLAVLEGKAWHDQRLNMEIKDAVDQEPVLEAILIWLNRNHRFDNT